MEKKMRGRPQSFPKRTRYCMYCTPEEAKILRESLERKRSKEQQQTIEKEVPEEPEP